MQFFKRLMCDHEVDTDNLVTPLCKHCGYEFPRILNNGKTLIRATKWWRNPALTEWEKNTPAFKALIEELQDQKDRGQE